MAEGIAEKTNCVLKSSFPLLCGGDFDPLYIGSEGSFPGLGAAPVHQANSYKSDISFNGNHVQSVPFLHTRRLETYCSGARCGAILVDDISIAYLLRAETKQCCGPPLTFSLPSIALQRVNKADGVLPTFCRQMRTISRSGMSGYGTREPGPYREPPGCGNLQGKRTNHEFWYRTKTRKFAAQIPPPPVKSLLVGL